MAIKASGLQTHIWNNNLKSLFLLGLYPLILILIFWVICFASGLAFTEAGSYATGYDRPINWSKGVHFATAFSKQYTPLIIAITAIWFVISWLYHTKMIRALAKSRPVTRKDEPALYNLLENMCIAEGVTMPRLEVIETHARNAFASGLTKSMV